MIHYHMPEYSELKDKNLSFYFNNEKRINYLKEKGLLTKEGYIINRQEDFLKKKEIYEKILQEKSQNKKDKEKIVSNEKVTKEKYNPYNEKPVFFR